MWTDIAFGTFVVFICQPLIPLMNCRSDASMEGVQWSCKVIILRIIEHGSPYILMLFSVCEQDRWPQSRRCGGGGGRTDAPSPPLSRDHQHLGVHTLRSGAHIAWWRTHSSSHAAAYPAHDLWPLSWPPHLQPPYAHLPAAPRIHRCVS